jgi:hypothetical protein
MPGPRNLVDKLLNKPVFKDQPEFHYAAFKQRFAMLDQPLCLAVFGFSTPGSLSAFSCSLSL